MKRLFFVQPFILLTLSVTLHASELRSVLKETVDEMNIENCVDKMEKISSILDNVKIDDYQQEFKNSGHETILHDLWMYKVSIHERLRSFHRTSEVSKSCADATRHALRSIRTTEDYVSDNQYRLYKETMTFPDTAFEEGNFHVRRHPEMADFHMVKDLRSGDILLTRGNAFTSAAIASLGEFDTQFSHMSMVYKDENNKLWTVEAHIEVGSFVRSLEDHILDKNARTMLFRYEDADLAHKAAEFIFKKVKKASDTTGNIFYDFGFDQEDSEDLFCSEVVSHAFDEVTSGTIEIPLHRSQLMSRKPEFVKMLGITASSSFVPADIEVDPRFKMIAEWRDVKKMDELLQKDAVLHAMYRWNDEHGYQMIQASSKTSFLYRNVAWPLRRVPFLKKYFIEKMPLNMSRTLIGYFGVLESVGELLQKNLKTQDEKAISERGIPLLRSEKYEVLDNFRQLDRSQKKKKLHKMFRPITVK
jgi:hypothetical protein